MIENRIEKPGSLEFEFIGCHELKGTSDHRSLDRGNLRFFGYLRRAKRLGCYETLTRIQRDNRYGQQAVSPGDFVTAEPNGEATN